MDLGTDLVLITGAAGWLGRNLVRALLEGLPDCPALGRPPPRLRVRALVLPGEEAALAEAARGAPAVETVVGDVRSVADCQRFADGAAGALLFHLAGVIHPRRVREFHQVNVEGSRNVLEAAASGGVRRAVVLSSNSPLGTNPHPDHLFDEDSPYRPYLGYGRSKLVLEEAARDFHRSGRLETVLVRAPWFYGPFQPARQTLFFAMVRDGRAPLVGGGRNLRSMAYVENLAQGLLLAAASPRAAGETYWIADRRPYSMNEIVDTVERLLEHEFGEPCARRRLRLPGLVSRAAHACDWALQKLGLYLAKVHVLSEMDRTIACSIEKAERELGYRPLVELEEGMRRSLRWLDARGGLPPPRGGSRPARPAFRDLPARRGRRAPAAREAALEMER